MFSNLRVEKLIILKGNWNFNSEFREREPHFFAICNTYINFTEKIRHIYCTSIFPARATRKRKPFPYKNLHNSCTRTCFTFFSPFLCKHASWAWRTEWCTCYLNCLQIPKMYYYILHHSYLASMTKSGTLLCWISICKIDYDSDERTLRDTKRRKCFEFNIKYWIAWNNAMQMHWKLLNIKVTKKS